MTGDLAEQSLHGIGRLQAMRERPRDPCCEHIEAGDTVSCETLLDNDICLYQQPAVCLIGLFFFFFSFYFGSLYRSGPR